MSPHPKQRASRSNLERVPWITFFFLAVALFLSLYQFTYIAGSVATDFDLDYSGPGQKRRQVAIFLIACLGIVLLISRGEKRLHWNTQMGLLLAALVGWVGLSTFWSDDPGTSLRRFIVFAFILTGALGVAARWSQKIILGFSVFGSAMVFSIGLGAEILRGGFSPLDPLYRFAGTLHPNEQGQLCAFLALTSIAALRFFPRKRVQFQCCILVGVTFLVLSKSITAVVAFILGAAVYRVLLMPKTRKTGVVIFWIVALLVLTLLAGEVISVLVSAAEFIGRSPEKLITLTGRIPLWEECMFYVRDRPWAGYGFEAFWTPTHKEGISYAVGWYVGSAHSTYVDLWLGLGVVGLGLHSLFMILTLWRSARNAEGEGNARFPHVASIVVFLLVAGLLETVTFLRFSATTFSTLTLVLSAAFASDVNSAGKCERAA